MKLLLSSIITDRTCGKTMRRVYPQIERFKNEFAQLSIGQPEQYTISLGLNQQKEDSFVEAHAGRTYFEVTMGFSGVQCGKDKDAEFLWRIFRKFETAILAFPFPDEDRRKVVTFLTGWKKRLQPGLPNESIESGSTEIKIPAPVPIRRQAPRQKGHVLELRFKSADVFRDHAKRQELQDVLDGALRRNGAGFVDGGETGVRDGTLTIVVVAFTIKQALTVIKTYLQHIRLLPGAVIVQLIDKEPGYKVLWSDFANSRFEKE